VGYDGSWLHDQPHCKGVDWLTLVNWLLVMLCHNGAALAAAAVMVEHCVRGADQGCVQDSIREEALWRRRC
jgi:hypothetical protein